MFFASLLRSQDSGRSTNTSFSSLPRLADRAPLVGPTLGEGVFHLLFRCLRDVLLLTELLIPLMFWFSADIGHAGFLVFKNVKDFALHCAKTRVCCLEARRRARVALRSLECGHGNRLWTVTIWSCLYWPFPWWRSQQRK